jgi:hypothetical protein
MAETLVIELASVPVHERSDRGGRPRCCFEVAISDGIEVLQHGQRACVAWLAGHDPLVDLQREPFGRVRRLIPDVTPRLLHELPQPLAPGILVRRVDQHAVNVEDGAPEIRYPFLLYPKGLQAWRARWLLFCSISSMSSL